MKSFFSKLIFLIMLIVLLFVPGVEANVGVNGKIIEIPEDKTYSFLLAGHLYGFPGGVSPYPASTFLANLDIFEKLKFLFVVLLGDTTRVVNKQSFDLLNRSVVDKISTSTFIVPGNHDYANPKLYEDYFGETYYSFRVGSEQFIFLNSEPLVATSSGQLDFIDSIFLQIENDSSIKNVVVFSHRLFWLGADPALSKLAVLINSRRVSKIDQDFWAVIKEKLNFLSNREIYFIAGDVGVGLSPSVLSHNQKNTNLHFVATGLGDDTGDAVVTGIIDQGNLRFEVLSLTSDKVYGLENYTTKLWADFLPESKLNNGVRSPVDFFQKVQTILLRKTFWLGMFLGIILGLTGFCFFKRKHSIS